MAEFTSVTRLGHITTYCSQGHMITVPDKGLGRITSAAWKTRHQHEDDK